MKKIVDRLAHSIAVNQNLDKDHEEIIAYGMLAFSQMVIILLLALGCGLLMGAVLECVSLYLCVGIFRKFTGGAHGSSMGQCIVVSVSSIAIMAALSKFILARFLANNFSLIFVALVFLNTYITVYLKAPVDSPNKPIHNFDKKKRLRMCAFIFITLILVIVSTLMITANADKTFYSVGFSLTLAMLWQTATLTPLFTFFKH